MTGTTTTNVRSELEAAHRAGRLIASAPADARSGLLNRVASLLSDKQVRQSVLHANAADLANAQQLLKEGSLSQSQFDRLKLDDRKLDGLCDGACQLASMPDPIGWRDVHRQLDEGLVLERRRVPLGCIAVAFESRPDALVQIAGLCLRSGNAAALKGGREAALSNAALHSVLQKAISDCDLPPSALVLLRDRSALAELLQHHDLVSLVVARGSFAFVEHIRTVSRIPVVGHAEGLCHLYLHADADAAMSAAIAVDAKCSYPAACNSIETLLWHAEAGAAVDSVVAALRSKGVRLVGCPATVQRFPGMEAASDSDWATEYGDLTLSIRQVADLAAALSHIERYGSRHTETIVCRAPEVADSFLSQVDAACVFHNASSRFADGYRFGMGAEVGISTDKLHARGPVGIEGLCTYRWLLHGQGQCASDYGPGARRFLHHDILRI